MGTVVPVVDEGDVYTGTLPLLDIPTGTEFRSALRVYDFDEPNNRQVRLRIYPVDSNTALVDTTVILPGTDLGEAFPSRPSTFMIGDLVLAYPQLASAARVRIALDPLTAGTRFWAFVSVTNNATQHVTAIVPR